MMRTMALMAAVAVTMIGMVPGTSHATDDSIGKIKAAGTLRACFADDNPWSFKDPASGEWKGFLPEMAEGLATSMEVKLEAVDADWSSLLQNLQSDKCDIIATSLFATVKRAEQVLFTDAIGEEYTTVFVPKDSPYHKYSDLDAEGKRIGVRAGGVPADIAAKMYKKAEVKPYLGANVMPILTDVATKRLDGWMDGVISTERFLAENKQFEFRAIGDYPLEPVKVVWALKAGDYQFQQLVNVYLYGYRNGGQMAKSWEQWFGSKYQAPKE